MKLKNLVISSLLLCFIFVCFMLCGCTASTKDKNTSYSDVKDKVWCITFQLVWNDFMDKFSNGKPVEFEGGNPDIADELNKRLYTTDVISDDSYYKYQGEASPKVKKQIEKEINRKFNEKSDILDNINWNVRNSYLFYVMLKKNFNFLTAFDQLPSAHFYYNLSTDRVKYFGIDKDSDKKLRENVDVLFYNSNNEYAVKLLTKENEEILLFRTDKNDSFENLYAFMEKNIQPDEFRANDILRIPNIEVDKTISYGELCGKRIAGSNYIISQAIQTIKFKMDNKGGTLKSEAAITVEKMALNRNPIRQRIFSFDKPFILFLKESGKDKPYYAMKVEDGTFLVKD